MEWTIYRREVTDAHGRTFQVWRTGVIGFGSKARGYAAFELRPGVLRTPTIITAWDEAGALHAAGYREAKR